MSERRLHLCHRSAVLLCLTLCVVITGRAQAALNYVNHHAGSHELRVETDGGLLTVTAFTEAAIGVHFEPSGEESLASFAIDPDVGAAPVTITDRGASLELRTKALTVLLEKTPLRLRYLRDGEELLAEESGFFSEPAIRGVRFALADGEQLIGGGSRVLGMDRRGHRLPLDNKPAYGYTREDGADQMYYGVPAVLSSRGYLLLWDNPARGVMDLGAGDPGVMQFHAGSGRNAYLFVAGADYPDTLKHYTAVTGRQPMPPRWALGNYASRFGYRSQAQVMDVVQRFRDAQIPLDAVVLDIFWFGPDVRGHMGNFDWDRDNFPAPEQMIEDLGSDDLQLVLVTEPFILSSSKQWESAVDAGALALNPAGEPHRFEFFFGNTGLVDVFSPRGQAWFWERYENLFAQGIGGVWGDLGEPEVHPAETLHALGSADTLHNAYGHAWAALVHDNFRARYPDRRPMILMRSGYAGTQRYGILPWSGDVLRDWGGLRPQVELNLQMGLLGLGYMHSDLGGFGEGEAFDEELYRRWLQFGVFQPLFRPHAQDRIPPEPVFHGDAVIDAARAQVELRYRLMPYLYTQVWENSRSGMPLARPLFFDEPDNAALFSYDEAYLWGPDLLVAPVIEAGKRAQVVYLPPGNWYDFFSGERYEGGRRHAVLLRDDRIPVFARGGAFIAEAPISQRLAHYRGDALTVNYFHDPASRGSSARVYDDDGRTAGAWERGEYQLMSFTATNSDRALRLKLSSSGGDYANRPENRRITLRIHNWSASPSSVSLDDGNSLPACEGARETDCYRYENASASLSVTFDWRGTPRALELQP